MGLAIFAAAEAEVVIRVVEALVGVPRVGAPAAVVLVGLVVVEDEPAALHLGDAGAAAGSEIRFLQRQQHVLGGVAVDVVDAEGADALGEVAGGVGVRAALRPVAAVAGSPACEALKKGLRLDSVAVEREVSELGVERASGARFFDRRSA